jgi:hypothetical protein
VQWLENTGGLNFTFHRIGDFAGAYNARAADFDHDGDLDVIVCSSFNLWEQPTAQSLIWLENDGHMKFARRNIANAPSHLLALELADFNGDGELDAVTSGMHVYPPYDRLGRVTLWTNHWGKPAAKE